MKPVVVIALFIFLCFGERAYSQTGAFTPEWSYGVNGGVTFSKVGFNSYVSVPQTLLRQFSGGVVVRYISEKHFGIQGELNYSQRGWKERTDSVHLNRYTRSLAYLELPVMTHIYFNLGNSVRLIFNLGPQIGYYIGAKEKEREVNDPEQDTSYYDTSVQHSFDYGLKGAMGLEFRTKAGSFILDGRYYFGLSDIFNNARADIFQASHNQVLGVNLTYLFR
ncbi:MAG: PorT family protein [Candidatus Azobacteroides sp.]|nr:PorT family protein [Candidatus Azobacteroides sp.]